MKTTLSSHKLVQNKEFGYLHIDPVPSSEELAKYYKEKYFSAGGGTTSRLCVQEEQSYYTNSRWNEVFFKLEKFFGGKLGQKNLLDIGCGYSQALLFFREKGLVVTGIEVSDDCILYAKHKNLKVIQESIENIGKLEIEKQDVITLFEVMEHLREPVELLKYIKQHLLNESGVLVIDVPNDFNDFQVVANQEYDLRSWWVCPPEHINYFSVDSLQYVLEKCGYEIFYKEATFPLELFLLMGDNYVEDSKVGSVCHERRVCFERCMREHGKSETLRNFYANLAKLNLGRSITMYARPKL